MPGTNQTRCQLAQDDSPQGFAVFTPPRAERSTALREIPQLPVKTTHDETRMLAANVHHAAALRTRGRRLEKLCSCIASLEKRRADYRRRIIDKGRRANEFKLLLDWTQDCGRRFSDQTLIRTARKVDGGKSLIRKR
jgi:hypothetical protein